MALVRAAIASGLAAAIALGALALLADRGRRLGTLGLALALAAQLAGGAGVEVATPVPPSPHLGLDWFVLDLLLLVLVFVPLERAFARLPEQPVFRRGWRTDLAHFFASHLLLQATSLLTLAPALVGRKFRDRFRGPIRTVRSTRPGGRAPRSGRPEQLLRGNRGPPRLRVQTLEAFRELPERPVHHLPHRPQRVILRHPLLRRDGAEHSRLPPIVAPHPSPPHLAFYHFPAYDRKGFSATC
jgi:hypothetical protein